MKKFKPVILLISFSLFFVILNGYVIAQPSKKQLEAFRSAKTVQIVVEQSYGEAKDASLPIMDVARRLLEYAGLQVVGSNVKEYDLYIKIEAEGEALSRSYTPGVKLYTGASLAGSILFKIPGIPIYEKFFVTYQSPPLRSPPYAISGSIEEYRTPSGALFEEILYGKGTVVSKIVEMMTEIYGITCVIASLKDEDVQDSTAYALGEIKDPRTVEPLIAALKDEDEAVRAHAAHALGKIKDPHAVGALIAVLKDNHEYIRYLSAIALEDITQKQFGENQEEWKKWWKENKEEFIKKK